MRHFSKTISGVSLFTAFFIFSSCVANKELEKANAAFKLMESQKSGITNVVPTKDEFLKDRADFIARYRIFLDANNKIYQVTSKNKKTLDVVSIGLGTVGGVTGLVTKENVGAKIGSISSLLVGAVGQLIGVLGPQKEAQTAHECVALINDEINQFQNNWNEITWPNTDALLIDYQKYKQDIQITLSKKGCTDK